MCACRCKLGLRRWPYLELPQKVSASTYHCAMDISVHLFVLFFARKNINCSIEESLERFREVCKAAKEKNILVRG